MIPKQRYTLDNVLNSRYYQMPKFLFEGELKSMSNDARILYALLKDRHELSIQNGWINKNNEVYLIYSREDMQDMLGVSNKTALNAVKELKKFGLIEEERQGRGQPNLIFLTAVTLENTQTCKNYTSRSVKSKYLDMENLHGNNTNTNNTENSNQSIYPEKQKENSKSVKIIPVEKVEKDGLIDNKPPEVNLEEKTPIKYSLEFIRTQLETDILEQEDKIYTELSELVFDVVNTSNKTIRINRSDIPTEVVRSRMLKLTSGHIQYVVENFNKQTAKIKNIRSYLVTALYNSYTSISGHYVSQAHEDAG